MKKLFISFVLLTLLIISACNVIQDDNDITVPDVTPTEDDDDGIGLVRSKLARETDPDIDQDQIHSLSQSNTNFALSFYDQIRAGDDNIIFSPFSISLALSMTMAGAETTTQEAMMSALQMNLPENEVHPAFNALLLVIEESQEAIAEDTEGSNFQLNIANAIWGQVGFNFKENFLDTLAVNYEAGINTVDFVQSPETARNAINKWVEEATEDKIQDLIPQGAIDTLTRLVLANAIYFNGSWLHPFRETATAEALFTTLDGSEITVDMMELSDEFLLYRQGENVQAVNLLYLSPDFAMTLLVPDEGKFSAFEETLNGDMLINILNDMKSERVNLQMPKFDFESEVNANEPLIALGMSEAFDYEKSDFSGIAEIEDLHITDVVHKATISIDEKGTEAAAATAVIVGVTSAPPDEPILLVIDRPFLFLIQHKPTGSILFMGRVIQP